MSSVNDFLAQTIVNVDDQLRMISTNHNLLPDEIAALLVTFEIDTETEQPKINGGYLKGIDDATRGDGDLAAFVKSVNDLVLLLQNGTGTPKKYVSEPFAKDVELFLKSVDSVSNGAVKWDGTMTNTNFTQEDLDEWFSLFVMNNNIASTVDRLINNYVKIEPYFDSGEIKYRVIGFAGKIAPTSSGNILGSLQTMVELIYVKGANEYLSQGMEDLEEALSLSKSALNSLQELQSMHSNLAPVAPGSFVYDLRADPSAPGKARLGAYDIDPNAGPTRDPYPFTLNGGTDDGLRAWQVDQGTQDGSFTREADAFFTDKSPGVIIGEGLENPLSLLTELQTEATALFSTSNLLKPTTPPSQFTDIATVINSLEYALTNRSIPSTEVVDKLFLYSGDIRKYNKLVTRANRQLDAIRHVYELAGITEINLDNYSSDPNSASYMQFFNAGGGGVVKVEDLKIQPLPEPSFNTLQLASEIKAGSETYATVQKFINEMREVFVTGPLASGETGLQPDFKKPVFSTAADSMGFDLADFLGTVFNDNLMITGTLVVEGVVKTYRKHPIYDFYDKMRAQKTTLDSIATALIAATPSTNSDKFDFQANSTLLEKLKLVNSSIAGIGTVATDINSKISSTSFTSHQIANKPPGIFEVFSGSTRLWDKIEDFAKTWLIDANDDLTQATNNVGRIQNDLGTAIGAAQTLNDAQKEETRRIMFIFEEFYKSAASILQKMSELLEKIARNVAK